MGSARRIKNQLIKHLYQTNIVHIIIARYLVDHELCLWKWEFTIKGSLEHNRNFEGFDIKPFFKLFYIKIS